MDEKRISEQESLELIASMIRNTKKRMELGSGNILLSWGYIVTIVALTIGLGLFLTGNINRFWAWFAIPIIGYPTHIILARKKQYEPVKTSIDQFISSIWTVIGVYFIIIMLICLIFGLYGLNAWSVMYLLTLPCCGFGTMATGVILKEKSLFIGGLFSMIVGGLFLICYICQINIFGYDIFIFALCFALMMIVPGHILNSKAKTRC